MSPRTNENTHTGGYCSGQVRIGLAQPQDMVKIVLQQGQKLTATLIVLQTFTLNPKVVNRFLTQSFTVPSLCLGSISPWIKTALTSAVFFSLSLSLSLSLLLSLWKILLPRERMVEICGDKINQCEVKTRKACQKTQMICPMKDNPFISSSFEHQPLHQQGLAWN